MSLLVLQAYNCAMMHTSSGSPTRILLCGTSRLWREMLGHVLQAQLGTQTVSIHPEPTCSFESDNTGAFDWLIWFMNSQADFQGTLSQFYANPIHSNLVLVAADGHAIIHRTDQVAATRTDISLDEIFGILRLTPPRRADPTVS